METELAGKVITPGIPYLPFVQSDGVKWFTLVAVPVKSEILPGIHMNAWGYNGSSPGPTICAYSGDEVGIRVLNKLPQPTSVHWHGLDVPNAMDGVPEIEPSPSIDPGRYFDYRFKITNPPGTHMYLSHVYTVYQDMMGLEGGFVILDPDEQTEDAFLIRLRCPFRKANVSASDSLTSGWPIIPFTFTGIHFLRRQPTGMPLRGRTG